MLVLTRKSGESIRIGDNIIVKVIELDGKHVKLGIEAPKKVTVNREEIYERIQKENKEASHTQEKNLKNIASWLRKEK